MKKGDVHILLKEEPMGKEGREKKEVVRIENIVNPQKRKDRGEGPQPCNEIKDFAGTL